MKIFVIRYSEIALKGKNRAWFELKLMNNIKDHLCSFENIKIKKIHGRIILTADTNIEQIETALRYIPGIANFSRASLSSHNLEEISAEAISVTGEYIEKSNLKTITFKVESRRSEKRFELNSPQLSAQIGGDLLEKFSELKVDLHNPVFEVGIEIWPEEQSIIYLEKIKGQGGLPVGSSGNVFSFLSGGIDSPVSSLDMIKRGCKTTYLHFYSYPFVGEESKQKIIDLAKHLSRYQKKSVLKIIPFTEVQKAIKTNCTERYRTILYRRLMYLIANAMRKDEKVLAYVSGEAVGQVASQTIENITCTEDASAVPVLRPLIGMGKAEIIEKAIEIGTYPISIQPFPDCCTVFQPQRPETKGRVEILREEEQKLDIEELVNNAVDNVETIEFKPSYQEIFF